MRVVLDRKMVVGHVMRYPGEAVELPDPPAEFAMENSEVNDAPAEAVPDEDEVAVPAPLRRRKKG